MNAIEKCPVCGKRGRRPCPATGGLICPACCGSNRGSKLPCPAECAFLPFGTAAAPLMQEVERGWFSKSWDFMQQRTDPKTLAAVYQSYLPQNTAPREQDKISAASPTLYEMLLVRRDAEGNTLADRWETASWQGLNNDERYLMQSVRQGYPAVLEVQRTLDSMSMECVDLLEAEPKPFTVRSYAPMSVPRFTRMLVWLSAFPHFRRIGDMGYEIPDLIWSNWNRILHDEVAEVQKTKREVTVRQLLGERLAIYVGLISVLLQEARERMLESLDVHHCLAEFRLQRPVEEVQANFDARPEFRPAQLAEERPGPKPLVVYDWRMQGEAEELKKLLPPAPASETSAERVLGMVRLYSDKLVVETFAKAKYQFMRSYLDQHFGALLQFQNEAFVDLAKQLNERQRLWPDARPGEPVAGADQPAEPAAMTTEKRQSIWAAHTQHYNQLLDQVLPVLDGLSPRAAAQSPAARPRLIEWLKSHIRHFDELNQREPGLNLNIDWVLDELGVKELR